MENQILEEVVIYDEEEQIVPYDDYYEECIAHGIPCTFSRPDRPEPVTNNECCFVSLYGFDQPDNSERLRLVGSYWPQEADVTKDQSAIMRVKIEYKTGGPWIYADTDYLKAISFHCLPSDWVSQNPISFAYHPLAPLFFEDTKFKFTVSIGIRDPNMGFFPCSTDVIVLCKGDCNWYID